MLDLELLAKRNNYLKSRHFLDYFQFDSTEKLDNPDSESDSEDYADKRLCQGKVSWNIKSESELEVYVDKRLYQGKVSWKINSDTDIDYVSLPVTLAARGGSKGGNSGGGGGEEPVDFPDYVTGLGNYYDLFSDFNIQLEFVGSGWTEDIYRYATSMAELYSYFIVGDEVDVTLEETSGRGKNRVTTTYNIDDIYVTMTIDEIDGLGGTLGYAGPEYARVVDGNNDTVIKGGLTLDSEDLKNIDASLIDDIIFHEIGHIVGFGTMFSYQDLVTGSEYIGAAATEAYAAAYQNPATPLLLEDEGGPGTAGGHWEENTGQLPGDEIMTGYINDQNWLSTVTIASYQDIGYETIWGNSLTTNSPVQVIDTITPDWGELLAQNDLV